jgi:SAM-dependent methyltransferase
LNWKVKANTLAVLSRMPGGRRLYHALQARLNARKKDDDNFLSRALEVVEMIQAAGADPRRGKYLEIGSGWRPFVPFLLYLAGAEQIITYDVNRWLNQVYALQTFAALASRVGLIAERLKLDVADLQKRLDAVGSLPSDLGGLLHGMHIDYRCPADARSTGLPAQSMDFMVSSNVLAHIPPEILRGIHREGFRVLRPGGLVVHRSNLDDHFSYVDDSITKANFLRFSEAQWRWYGGTGLGYHNRLRGVQHRRLLEEAGFQVLSERERVDPRSLEALQTGAVPVHPDFASFTPEEMAASYLWIVCKRPD